MELFFNRIFYSEDSVSIIVAIFATLTIFVCMLIFIKTYSRKEIDFFRDEILVRAYRKSHPHLTIDKKLAKKNAEEKLGSFFDDKYFKTLKQAGILTNNNRIQYAQLDRASDIMCYMFLTENASKRKNSGA